MYANRINTASNSFSCTFILLFVVFIIKFYFRCCRAPVPTKRAQPANDPYSQSGSESDSSHKKHKSKHKHKAQK